MGRPLAPPPPPLEGDEETDFVRRLGALIRRRRLCLGLSQETVAARMDLRQTFISQWENGRAAPRTEKFLVLCRVLEVDQLSDLYALLETPVAGRSP